MQNDVRSFRWNKLTVFVLFFIFLSAGAHRAWAQETAAGPMNDQTLLARSYRPELVSRILLRSTGRARIAAAPEEGQMVQQAPRPVMPRPVPSRPPRQPALTPPSLPSPQAHSPLPRPVSRLNSHALERLKSYDDPILRYSRMNGLDPNLVRAVIYVESSGHASAVSPKGALGLMQLMPATASDMGVSNSFDPAQNIFGGARYLGGLLDRFKRLDLALWAYNAGPEAVVRKRLPLETKRYIPEVLRIKAILSREES